MSYLLLLRLADKTYLKFQVFSFYAQELTVSNVSIGFDKIQLINRSLSGLIFS
jgi:hypothetical protein